jgi:chromate transporter
MTIADLGRYFLRLGALGFGGPIALVGAMRRDLVEERAWFSAEEFSEGLALAQLAPGPLAAQLAIYLGWLRGRLAGATLAGVAFIAPSFLMVLGLSVLYVRFGGLPWMRGAFYGIGAAVIAIIARSALTLTRMTLGRRLELWLLWAVNLLVVVFTRSEIVWVFAASGLVTLLWHRSGTAGGSRVVASVAPVWLLAKIFGFFAKAGTVVFGSGLAIVPFLYGGVVERYHWLTEGQFLDAVAVSMITPGPVVITVAFIGYLTAGPLGGIAAALGVFAPVYLIVVLAAPHYRRLTGNASVRAFVGGVTAAAAGALAGAVFVLARRAIVDVPTLGIALVTVLLPFAALRAPEPVVIGLAGLAGIALSQ